DAKAPVMVAALHVDDIERVVLSEDQRAAPARIQPGTEDQTVTARRPRMTHAAHGAERVERVEERAVDVAPPIDLRPVREQPTRARDERAACAAPDADA